MKNSSKPKAVTLQFLHQESPISRTKGPDEKVDPGKLFHPLTKMETPGQLPQEKVALAQMKNSDDSG